MITLTTEHFEPSFVRGINAGVYWIDESSESHETLQFDTVESVQACVAEKEKSARLVRVFTWTGAFQNVRTLLEISKRDLILIRPYTIGNGESTACDVCSWPLCLGEQAYEVGSKVACSFGCAGELTKA